MADEQIVPEDVADDDVKDDQVTEEDLKKLKDEGEVEATPDETPKSDETEEESEEKESFVKEFPQIKGETPEEYARNLEEAYKNSTSEALRLKRESEAKTDEEISEDAEPVDPRLLYIDQMVQRDAMASYEKFKPRFSQTEDPIEYDKFQNEVANLQQYFINTQGRTAPASELYSKAAAILGWEPSDVVESKDKLDNALKDRASQSKTSSATKPKSISKITDSQISIAKQMGGWTEGKSDAEIRKELEGVT